MFQALPTWIECFFDATSFNKELCGAAWVDSKAPTPLMFSGSSGSISETACTTATRQSVPRRPFPQRELIVRTPIVKSLSTTAKTTTCAKCGTFEKSGKYSCCAPGGDWYRNCGGAGNKH